jgi:phospholipase C
VPAVVVSPWIARNVVDHRVYDHTSVLATVEKLFGVQPLTHRDAAANSLTSLGTLANPRNDAPFTLPAPANSGLTDCPPVDFTAPALAAMLPVPVVMSPDVQVNQGNLAGVLHSALRSDLALSPAAARSKVLAQFSGIKTRADAMQYADAVRAKMRAARGQ